MPGVVTWARPRHDAFVRDKAHAGFIRATAIAACGASDSAEALPSPANGLYFAAGPNSEANRLFGTLTVAPEDQPTGPSRLVPYIGGRHPASEVHFALR